MWSKNVETFLGCEADWEEAEIVVFGAPFDSTTSFRPGTRFASHVMRGESYGLETYSPYQDSDLTDCHIFDGGDLELPFGNAKRALIQIEEATRAIVQSGKRPCMIGGEHLVTLGAFRAVYEKYHDVHVIHFDAHTDLREEYLGETLSHATVLRRIWDIVGDGRIHQFGIRSGEKTEFEWAKQHTDLHKFNLAGLQQTVEQCRDFPVYVTIDLDVLDPSVFPGTGTPEASGITFLELLNGILDMSKLNIIGMDLVELSPGYDQSGVSTATACKVLRELLLAYS